jgi:hypothetical protein
LVSGIIFSGGEPMQENIVIRNGIFYDGSTKEEIEYIKSLYPNKEIIVHTIIPGEAHITVYDKTTNQ